MLYLLKVTAAWTVFLIIFEAFYKNNGRFSVNRFYLLSSVALGLLIPLISLPASAPAVVSVTQQFYPTALNVVSSTATATNVVTAATTTVSAAKSLDFRWIIRMIYGLGAALFFLKFMLDFGRIIRLVLRKPSQIVAGQKVIVTGKKHAPYSFMGWIFISDLHLYQAAELDYIIHHEAAHNRKKHWLDLLLIQLICIVLWFHPLIWRYRYLLQLQHEYEADDLAARDDAYAYGHFLLQQSLLNGVPSIAHSFHFSPIKNRIKMLTKKQDRPTSTWKYFLVVPALLACTFLMAKATDKPEPSPENTTAYKGNTFTWGAADTVFYDQAQNRTIPIPEAARHTKIVRMNNEPVYQNEYLKTPASYGSAEMDYADYLRQEFAKHCKNTMDSATGLILSNIVVNKEGKVVYYNVKYYRPYLKMMQGQNALNPFPERDYILNGIVDKIIAEGPNWKPAAVNGQAVNSMVNLPGC